jgi:hypothetical protein
MTIRGDEVMYGSNVNLQEEITRFRQKLDNLLVTKPLDCVEVQELSIKLDELIAEYYVQERSYSVSSGL